MSQILKGSSFSIVRTNSKLTTNIKIVADSKNRVFLESFDAHPILSQSQYKAFEVTGGLYSFDINRFYSQGTLLSSDIAYFTHESDESFSTKIKDKLSDQYDFFYAMGTQPKNSRSYQEELSMFHPLWVDSNNIPEYFVIFKMDGPMSVDINSASIIDYVSDSSDFLEQLTSDSANFYKNYIKTSRIVKTFDLTNKTEIGKYIRNHVNDANFPSSSIYASLNKGELTYWRGISYDQGGFCSRGLETYIDYSLVDKTMIESDDFITLGFKKNNIIHPNILNLEFLFDDPEFDSSNPYHFSRYFGLYVSAVQLGEFYLSGDRLFEDRSQATSQYPTPLQKNQFGYPWNESREIVSNPKGVKIYPNIEDSTPGSTSILNGRLLTWEEVQNPRLGFVKDADDNFYSVNSTNSWVSSYTISPTGPMLPSIDIIDSGYLRLKNTKINLQNFTGFDEPFVYIPFIHNKDKVGIPSFSFSIINSINQGDEIRISIIDPTNPNTDFFTVIADSSLQPGISSGISYSTKGTNSQIASAISNAINNIPITSGTHQIFSSISIENMVIVYSRIYSEQENDIEYSFFSTSLIFPWTVPNINIDPIFITDYVKIPIEETHIESGLYYTYHFSGGCSNPNSRFSINKEDLKNLFGSEPIFIKTDKGYSTISDYAPYLDEPILDNSKNIIGFNNVSDYLTCQIADTTRNIDFSSTGKIALYKYRKSTNGYFSIFPVRDFDFDFFDTSYNKSADSNTSEFYDWYKSGPTGINSYSPTFNYSDLDSGKEFIDSLIGPNSDFLVKGEFQTLNSEVNEILDVQTAITNEYDRLKENILSELATSSRVVPFINKWTFEDEGTDVRENSYRLNSDQSFGFSNFSPAFDEYSPNSKFFTHEWYYLQEYPPYLSLEEKLSSYSYFNRSISNQYFPLPGSSGSTAYYNSLISSTGPNANLLSINEDYFSEYFIRTSVPGTPSSSIPEVYAPKQYRYTIFKEGSNSKFPETMFRGIKVLIKDRIENSLINYNTQNINFSSNTIYNSYKFSSVLTYGSGYGLTVIKNDKYSAITLIIQADLKDDVLLKANYNENSTYFIDRSSLYTLKHKLENTGSVLDYTDVNISGVIDSWTWDSSNSSWLVKFKRDSYGNYPNLSNQLSATIYGTHNPVITSTISDFSIQISNIYDITNNSLRCKNIIINTPFGPDTFINDSSNNLKMDSSGITTNPSIFSSYPSQNFRYEGFSIFDRILLSDMKYVNGGYNAYDGILSKISFANIANDINSGNPLVKYINVDLNGVLGFNTFCIELVKPDYIVKGSYLETEPIKELPIQLQNYKGVIGYDLTSSSRAILSQITRNRGGYDPKFRDLIQFIDPQDIRQYGLIDNNIQILSEEDQIIEGNTYTISDNNIGKINNLFFDKVNLQNPGSILTTEEVYPLIDEIAIDRKDFSIFKSNWDSAYYTQYPRNDVKETLLGTRENKEFKSFFGSKVLSIRNTVSLQTFPEGVISPKELVIPSRINSVPQNLVGSTNNVGKRTELVIDAYIDLALQDYLISDGISAPFMKYLNPNYLKGTEDIEKYVKEYISENIVERYFISNIVFWEAYWKPENPLPLIQYNLTDEQKITAGYVKSKNFITYKENPEDLNFRLIYNIPKDRNVSIAFSVNLEKK